jgi:hypothetical protein
VEVTVTGPPGHLLLTWQDIAVAANGRDPQERQLLMEIVAEKTIDSTAAVATADGPWYLKQVRVRGHIGIGEQPAELPLTPKAGLTIITARNGTGKTSIADGARHNLSGGMARSYKVLPENVHCVNREVVIIITNGQQEVEITCGPDEIVRWHEKGGSVSAPPTEWTEAFARYMPVLLYPELSRVIEDPGNLHAFLKDALELTALEELQRRLKEIRSTGAAAHRDVKRQHDLALVGVERLGRTDLADLLRAKGAAPDEAAAEQIRYTVEAFPEATPPPLSLPEVWQVDDAVSSRALTALTELAAARESHVAGARLVHNALRALLSADEPALRHGREADVCPVCGAEDRRWTEQASAEVARLGEITKALSNAEKAASTALVQIADRLPPPLPSSLRAKLLDRDAGHDLRINQWDRLSQQRADVAGNDMSVAVLTILLDACADLALWYQPIRDELLTQRDDVLTRQAEARSHVQTWIKVLNDNREALTKLAVADRLHRLVDGWLRAARAAIFEPIGEQIADVWAALNSDSDLKLTDISLKGGTQQQRWVSLGLADGDVPLPTGKAGQAVLS